jgi:ABC-type transport system substrate-binding protein
MEIKTGDVDLMEAPLKYATELETDESVKIYTGASDRQMQLSMPVHYIDPAYEDNWYTKDVKVRQAINYALDKQELIDLVLDGWGWVPVGQVRAGYAGYAPYLAKYEHDIEKAKQLLAEAGYPDGFEITIMCEGRDYRAYAEDGAVVIKDQLAKVGIDVTIEIVDKATNGERRFTQQYEIMMGGWRGGSVPHTIIDRVHSRNSGPGVGQWNFEAIQDSRIDELLDQLAVIPVEDVDTWKPISDEVQQIVIEEAYECPLWDRMMAHATTLRVMDYQLDPGIGVTVFKPNINQAIWLEQD